MNLRELLGINLFLQIFDGTASYFILSRGEAELNPFVSAAIDAWGLLGVGLLESLRLRSAGNSVIAPALPAGNWTGVKVDWIHKNGNAAPQKEGEWSERTKRILRRGL